MAESLVRYFSKDTNGHIYIWLILIENLSSFWDLCDLPNNFI